MSNILSTIGIFSFSGPVPLDPLLSSSLEEGKDFIQSFPNSATFSAISNICQTLLNNLDWLNTSDFCRHPEYELWPSIILLEQMIFYINKKCRLKKYKCYICHWRPVISNLESLIWLWHTSAHQDNFNIVDTMFNLGLRYMSFRQE